MNRVLGFGFALVLVTGAVLIITTSDTLPPRVASHFGVGGVANGWQSRETYVTMILVFAITLPLAVVAAMAWLPRRFARLVNLPSRDYWLAPERRASTQAALTGFAFALGSLVAVFVVALHVTIVAANASTPPLFSDGPFWMLAATFVAAIASLVVWYHRRFRMPR